MLHQQRLHGSAGQSGDPSAANGTARDSDSDDDGGADGSQASPEAIGVDGHNGGAGKGQQDSAGCGHVCVEDTGLFYFFFPYSLWVGAVAIHWVV